MRRDNRDCLQLPGGTYSKVRRVEGKSGWQPVDKRGSQGKLLPVGKCCYPMGRAERRAKDDTQ